MKSKLLAATAAAVLLAAGPALAQAPKPTAAEAKALQGAADEELIEVLREARP